MRTGTELITEERKRQVEKEGWTPEHDANKDHTSGQIVKAAICYAMDYYGNMDSQITGEGRAYWRNEARIHWPWHWSWWKPTPKDSVRQLTKAGALIAAEIDRLQRLASPH